MTDVLEPGADVDGPPPARSHVARNTALVVGAVLVLFIGVLATSKPPADTPNELVGRRVPALAGATMQGGQLDVDSLRGRWVLVNFLASWCVGCVEEHPDLIRFAQAHRDDATIVGVAYNDDVDKLREFFRVKDGNWPVIVPDRGSSPAVDFGVTGVPESFLVSPAGQVVAWSQGVTYDWLEEMMVKYGGPPQ